MSRSETAFAWTFCLLAVGGFVWLIRSDQRDRKIAIACHARGGVYVAQVDACLDPTVRK